MKEARYYKQIFVILLLSSGASLLPLSMSIAQDLREVRFSYQKGKRTVETEVLCKGKTPGRGRSMRSGAIRFTPLKKQVQKVKRQIAAQPSKVKLVKKLKNLQRLFRAAKQACRQSTPPDSGGDGTPYFDNATGDLTENGRISFGIPDGLSGNVLVGQQIWSRNCIGCHEERRKPTFTELRTAISQPPMGYTREFLSDADLAQIMTYVSRFRSPGRE